MNAQTFSSEELRRRTLERRAVDAAIWGMPIVSVHAMREAFFRDAKAKYNDIVFWSKPSDWQNQTTTPNASARYVYFNFNTQPDGPVVLEVPAAVGAGLFGTLLDAWQCPSLMSGQRARIEAEAAKTCCYRRTSQATPRRATSWCARKPTTAMRSSAPSRRRPVMRMSPGPLRW